MITKAASVHCWMLLVWLHTSATTFSQSVCSRQVSYGRSHIDYYKFPKTEHVTRCGQWSCYNTYITVYIAKSRTIYTLGYRQETFCCRGYTSLDNYCAKCTEGFFGDRCLEKCSCQNNGTCHHVSGDCDCTSPGWRGTYCQIECPYGTYGYYCSMECGCNENQDCNTQDGTCSCRPGKTGRSCENECNNWTWGLLCKETCNCSFNTTDHCDPVTGHCICLNAFSGPVCTEAESARQDKSGAWSDAFVGPIVGGSVTLMTLVIVSTIVCIKITQQRRRVSTENITNPALIEDSSALNESSEEPVYSVVNKIVNKRGSQVAHRVPSTDESRDPQNIDTYADVISLPGRTYGDDRSLEDIHFAAEDDGDYYTNEVFERGQSVHPYNRLDHSGRIAIVDTAHRPYDHLQMISADNVRQETDITYHSLAHGLCPESGYGIDPEYVTTEDMYDTMNADYPGVANHDKPH